MPGMRARAELPLCFAFCGLALAQQPQSWTSHDQLSLTYYFYWYNAHTGQHMGDQPITRLTLLLAIHTSAPTVILTSSFTQRELSDMTPPVST